MRQRFAEEAERLRRSFGVSDPFELADALGIHVWRRYGLKQLKGFYAVQFRERYIVVSKSLCEEDQRMVAAHELGHDRLHRQSAQREPLRDWELYASSSQMEYEANLFAAELLISDEDVRRLVEGESADARRLSAELGCDSRLVGFKLYSMAERGYPYRLPEALNSGFLAR